MNNLIDPAQRYLDNLISNIRTETDKAKSYSGNGADLSYESSRITIRDIVARGIKTAQGKWDKGTRSEFEIELKQAESTALSNIENMEHIWRIETGQFTAEMATRQQELMEKQTELLGKYTKATEMSAQAATDSANAANKMVGVTKALWLVAIAELLVAVFLGLQAYGVLPSVNEPVVGTAPLKNVLKNQDQGDVMSNYQQSISWNSQPVDGTYVSTISFKGTGGTPGTVITVTPYVFCDPVAMPNNYIPHDTGQKDSPVKAPGAILPARSGEFTQAGNLLIEWKYTSETKVAKVDFEIEPE